MQLYMKLAEKCAFLAKNNFNTDFSESDMDLVYIVAKITDVKMYQYLAIAFLWDESPSVQMHGVQSLNKIW